MNSALVDNLKLILSRCDVDTSQVLLVEQDEYLILEGYVDSYPAIFKVAELIQHNAYVPVLLNRLRVRLPGEIERYDTDLARDISQAFKSNRDIERSNLRYSVRQGVVTISGTTSDATQVEVAMNILIDIHGIDDVLNQVHIAQ